MFEQHDDAIDLLKRDHREVETLFSEFAKAEDDSQRIELAQRICSDLSIHARVEEELFYPAARDALGHDDASLVYEANVEHAGLKQLIGEINGSSVDNEMFSARMQVLKEYVQHHVREEEMRLMPALRRTVINLDALGDSIARRKQDLLEQAESARVAPTGKRVQVPGIEQETATTRNRRSAPKRAGGKSANRKTASAPRARARPAKRRAAGKRKSNPASQRRSVARRKV
jgi:hemerythrin superfamily protein